MTRADLIETMARAMCAAQCELGTECVDCSFWDADEVAARAALAAIEAAGYRVVPVHPTEAMMDAFNTPASFMASVSFAERWKLALAAAPKNGGPR